MLWRSESTGVRFSFKYNLSLYEIDLTMPFVIHLEFFVCVY